MPFSPRMLRGDNRSDDKSFHSNISGFVCFVLGLCHNTDIIVPQYMSPLLLCPSNMHSHRPVGPASSPIARILMMTQQVKTCWLSYTGLANQTCLGLVNQHGQLIRRVYINLQGEETAPSELFP